MKVFATGATGHLGSALVPELISAGHAVTALARSDASAAAVEALGATAVRGDLGDLDVLRSAAADADGVVHLAFRHDLMTTGRMDEALKVDTAALQAFGEALAGSGAAFVGISGTLNLGGLGRVATEDDVAPWAPRQASEDLVVAMAEQGIRSTVARISPITHSPERDRHGFVRTLIQAAQRTGEAAYVGDGDNRWTAAHTLDTARLLRLAVEKAPAGSRLHVAESEGVTTRRIAEAIGAHLGLPVVGIDQEAAQERFGFLAMPLALDAPASSEFTRRVLGWEPVENDLLTDLADDRYYRD